MLREREFVDYFSELRGRPLEEQMSLIGSARYEVFVRRGHTGKAASLIILSLLLGFAVASLPVVFGIESLLLRLVFIPLAVVIFMQVYKRLYGRLLKQGLSHVLERQS